MNDFKEFVYADILYLIYSDGKVFNTVSNNFLKQSTDIFGYKYVNLGRKGNRKIFKVHRLVAISFIPNNYNIDFDSLTVNHKDYDKSNNHYTNLEWMTREENASDSYKQTNHRQIGETNFNAKLKKDEVLQIIALLDKYSNEEIARKFNVNKATIYDIRTKRTWKHLT